MARSQSPTDRKPITGHLPWVHAVLPSQVAGASSKQARTEVQDALQRPVTPNPFIIEPLPLGSNFPVDPPPEASPVEIAYHKNAKRFRDLKAIFIALIDGWIIGIIQRSHFEPAVKDEMMWDACAIPSQDAKKWKDATWSYDGSGQCDAERRKFLGMMKELVCSVFAEIRRVDTARKKRQRPTVLEPEKGLLSATNSGREAPSLIPKDASRKLANKFAPQKPLDAFGERHLPKKRNRDDTSFPRSNPSRQTTSAITMNAPGEQRDLTGECLHPGDLTKPWRIYLKKELVDCKWLREFHTLLIGGCGEDIIEYWVPLLEEYFGLFRESILDPETFKEIE